MAKFKSSRIDRFEFERNLSLRGASRIAGIDEAGRGPLAGPVVAAAVILPRSWTEHGILDELEGLNDSKQLTVARREHYFRVLTTVPGIEFAIARIEADVIDSINILQATYRAMNSALAALEVLPDHALVDGHPVPALVCPQTAVVKGDALSYSIAAASVLAKVTRDALMAEHDRLWPQYGFAGHKGYGTPHHLAALREHGPCPIHRRSFAPVRSGTVQEEGSGPRQTLLGM